MLLMTWPNDSDLVQPRERVGAAKHWFDAIHARSFLARCSQTYLLHSMHQILGQNQGTGMWRDDIGTVYDISLNHFVRWWIIKQKFCCFVNKDVQS